MKVTYLRTIDPMFMQVSVEIPTEDLNLVFTEASDPNVQLYYDLMGPGWLKADMATQMATLTRFAIALENAKSPATTIQTTFLAPEPK